MQTILNKFVTEPENPVYNFQLAEQYENQKHSASAMSYYLRAAEFGVDDNLTYEALIKVAKCLGKLGNRPHSEKGAYLNAIAFQPERPEAYFFLSLYHEYYQEWQECYTMAQIGLVCVDNYKPTQTNLGYPGVHALIFQKAFSSWHIGLGTQARELMQKLSNEYINEMSYEYKTLVQSNLTRLGL